MKINTKIIENNLKINFNNKKLLIQSLTHKSYSEKHNNEKLEFLGDRVIGLVISKKLLSLYPNENEGVIDKIDTLLQISIVSKTKSIYNKSVTIVDFAKCPLCLSLIL